MPDLKPVKLPAPRGTPEAAIERSVCDYAKGKGCYVRKFTSPNHRSVPDRLFIAPGGKVLFIEFKAPGKKSTPAQRREQARLLQVGARVAEVDNAVAGKELIDHLIGREETDALTQ